MDHDREPTAFSALHPRHRHREGPCRRGWLEQPRSGTGVTRLHAGQPLAEPQRILTGREAIVAFLTRKWSAELGYRLIKEFWAFEGDRIAVRFAYEWHDAEGRWFRSYGNENWAFDANGLMRERHACVNDVPIGEADRLFHWDASGPRPAEHLSLSDLGL